MSTFDLQTWTNELLAYVLALPDVPCPHCNPKSGYDHDCWTCNNRGTIPHPLRDKLLPLLSVPCGYYEIIEGIECRCIEGRISVDGQGHLPHDACNTTGRVPRDVSVFLNDHERHGFLLGLANVAFGRTSDMPALIIDSMARDDSLERHAQAFTEAIHRLGEQTLKDWLTKLSEEMLPELIDLLKKHGYVFNRAPAADVAARLDEMSDGERWEHLAFRLWTQLAEITGEARQYLEQAKEQEAS